MLITCTMLGSNITPNVKPWTPLALSIVIVTGVVPPVVAIVAGFGVKLTLRGVCVGVGDAGGAPATAWSGEMAKNRKRISVERSAARHPPRCTRPPPRSIMPGSFATYVREVKYKRHRPAHFPAADNAKTKRGALGSPQ
jgi:hypothetical protein